jgi:two-component system LytT family response regulator
MNPNITAVIVDDEALSAGVIEAYLKAFPQIVLTGKFTKSRMAVDKIAALKPDLLFLDVQMPVMDGFQLLRALEGRHDPYVIFTTAFDEYAIQAFEVNAVGYLLKPFDQEKFNNALHRFLERYGKPAAGNSIYAGLLKMLQEQQPDSHLEKIMIRDQQRIFYIPVTDVLYFEASGDYVKVVTAAKNYLVNDSLAALESKVPPQQFIRIHRSFMINAEQVLEFIPYFNGEYKIVMRNKEVVKMSRNYKGNLTRIFKEL